MLYTPNLQAIVDVLQPALVFDSRIESTLIRLTEANEPNRPPAELALRKSQQAIVISFEKGFNLLDNPQGDLPNWLFPLFQPDKGLRKSCDYSSTQMS